MSRYKVTWVIDIEAGSPRKAAEQALAIQRDVFSTATYFTVKDTDAGTEIDVDLEEAEDEKD